MKDNAHPEAEAPEVAEALVAVYAFILECQEKKATHVPDGHEGDDESESATVG
jgi:hypothetical protein